MSKNFKIARKPGQNNVSVPVETQPEKTATKSVQKKRAPASVTESKKRQLGSTTRKTIEVPEDYFYMVKMRALKRRILEKELWAEILADYFENHPN